MTKTASFQVPAETYDLVGRLAKEAGVTRSAWLRNLFLANLDERQVTETAPGAEKPRT